jgi:hypothetical protein
MPDTGVPASCPCREPSVGSIDALTMAIIVLGQAQERAPKTTRKPTLERVRALQDDLETVKSMLVRIHQARLPSVIAERRANRPAE